MENGPFTDDFPNKTSIYNGFSIAMLNYQRVGSSHGFPNIQGFPAFFSLLDGQAGPRTLVEAIWLLGCWDAENFTNVRVVGKNDMENAMVIPCYTRVLPPVIKHSNWKSPVRSVSEGFFLGWENLNCKFKELVNCHVWWLEGISHIYVSYCLVYHDIIMSHCLPSTKNIKHIIWEVHSTG